jgi:hypothetical protein
MTMGESKNKLINNNNNKINNVPELELSIWNFKIILSKIDFVWFYYI